MRRSISVSFFSMVSTLLVVGTLVMGLSQMTLFAKYFAEEHYATGDQMVSLAIRVVEQAYADRDVVQQEDGDEAARKTLELIWESSGMNLLVTDQSGNVLLELDPAVDTNKPLSASCLDKITRKINAEENRYHGLTDLDGFLPYRSYVTATRADDGYLFVYTPVEAFNDFLGQMFSNFLLSASLMLLCAMILTIYLSNRLTAPLHEISQVARKFGGGDMTVRVENVNSEDEVGQLAADFNTMAANLEAMDRSRAQFTGNIAHELRTPMTTIKGFIDGMLDGTIPPELQNHYLNIVSQEVGRLARLVQNMLDITKLESGEYQVHARLYNVWETLAGAAISAEQRITNGKINLEGLEEMGQTLVYADPDLIHQVAYNLLDNAIKFTPENGTIRLSAQRLGPEVEISIWNSGQGISAEALPFVFERFYKEDQSRGLHARGSGLGLHICKVLVNLSGGRIWVESKQGEWCKFAFTLPAELPNKKDLLKLSDQTEESKNQKNEKKHA